LQADCYTYDVEVVLRESVMFCANNMCFERLVYRVTQSCSDIVRCASEFLFVHMRYTLPSLLLAAESVLNVLRWQF